MTYASAPTARAAMFAPACPLRHHLRDHERDLGGISGDALRHDAVIAGEHHNRRAAGIGLERARDKADMDGKLLDAAERAKGLRLGVHGGPQARLKRAAERGNGTVQINIHRSMQRG